MGFSVQRMVASLPSTSSDEIFYVPSGRGESSFFYLDRMASHLFEDSFLMMSQEPLHPGVADPAIVEKERAKLSQFAVICDSVICELFHGVLSRFPHPSGWVYQLVMAKVFCRILRCKGWRSQPGLDRIADRGRTIQARRFSQ